jgi:aerobic-type carbon monoxide dehydrogenase small subunit (CoxS/CutS family)
LTAYSLFLKIPKPTKAEIIQALDDNLCRCGAHTRIIQAVNAVAVSMGGGSSR